MSEEIFRKKSLDKIKSPENLNDYLRVSNPGVWLLLAAVIVLLLGAVIWGVYGHIDTTVTAQVTAEDGTAVCVPDKADAESVLPGMKVRVGAVDGVVGDALPDGGFLLELGETLPDGSYTAEIVIESISPMSFVTN